MKVKDKVIIKDLSYLAPYWRKEKGVIIAVHRNWCDVEVRGQILYLTKNDFVGEVT